MVKCSRCDKEKDDSEFGQRGSKRQPYCKVCQREYARQHYTKNKDKYLDKARKAQKKWDAFLIELKSTTPCADCGRQYPHYQMEFDHLPRYTKAGSPSRGPTELDKCEVVCVLCHAKRTWVRRAEVA